MPTVGLVVHPDRESAKELGERSRRWWTTRGFDVIETHWPDGDTVSALRDSELAFAVSLGGDGTMLRTVQLVAAMGVPVLGVNLGNLGYLTQVEPGRIESAFERLIAGDFLIEERFMLEVAVQGGGEPNERFLVFNEIALEKTTAGHTVHLAVNIDGRPFLTYVADGLVVATPTGSTAYNLSLRGPILSPTLRAMVLTPISPHMLFDRTLVLTPDETVGIEVLDERPAVLVFDGSIGRQLDAGSSITVGASPHIAHIVNFGTTHFHGILRSKFGLADR